MYKLDNGIITDCTPFRRPTVSVIGCGGTGGFVAEGLCRLLPTTTRVLLVDMDQVEERNLYRSNFTSADLGKFKSEVLARHLAQKYDRAIAYSTLPVGMLELPRGLVIGCVDNGLARKQIGDKLPERSWWIDSGNGQNYGQVLIGNHPGKGYNFYFFERDICYWLPVPTLQQPQLLAHERRHRSCDEAVAADEQGPTINEAMAVLVLEVVRQIIQRTCTWMQLYLDLDAGTMHSVMATPDAVATILKVSVRRLTAPEKGGEK